MTKRTKTYINIIITLVIVAYLIFSLVLCSRQEQQRSYSGIEVTVLDSSEARFLSASAVCDIVDDSLSVISRSISEVSVQDIEQFLRGNEYIDSVEVYSTLDGVVKIRITQPEPLFRIISEQGYDFYVDSLYRVFRPVKDYSVGVIKISGDLAFDFGIDYYGKLSVKKHPNSMQNIKKLRNFVDALRSERFLQGVISQIYVSESVDSERITKFNLRLVAYQSTAVIEFGDLEDIAHKLRKLVILFSDAYKYASLDSAKVIDLRYRDQIVVVE